VPPPERLLVALLAAGESRRFGMADKRVVPLAGRPLLHWAAAAGRAVPAAQHILVAGCDLAPSLLPAGYDHLINADAGEGLAASLRLAAHHACAENAGALMILLGDMPLVTADHLVQLLALFHPARPVFSRPPDGPPQPPALFPPACFPLLEALSGDSGARSLAADALIAPATAESLIDIDTPEDLAHCAALLA